MVPTGYSSVLQLESDIKTPLVCQICKCMGTLTICDTNIDGFVCKNEACKHAVQTLGDVLGMDFIRMKPVNMFIEVVRNIVTGELELQTVDGKEHLPTSVCLLFQYMQQHDIFVRPGHKHVIKMTFTNNDSLDTICIEVKKPLEYVVGEDGATTTFCDKWYFQKIPGGNLLIRQTIPIEVEGRHMITLDFTDMERIL